MSNQEFCNCDDSSCQACINAITASVAKDVQDECECLAIDSMCDFCRTAPRSPPKSPELFSQSPPGSPELFSRSPPSRKELERNYQETTDEVTRLLDILKKNKICYICGKKEFLQCMGVSRLIKKVYCTCNI